jgi:hypothetical protein
VAGMLFSPVLGTAAYEAAPRLVWPAAGLVALAAAATVAPARRRSATMAP